MGREIRMVTPEWEHPKKDYGNYRPLYDNYETACSDFLGAIADHDLQYAIDEYGAPDKEDYMPVFAEGTDTHFMMYESCSEGTPLSPAFATIEELARWLADNDASAFAGQTATYEQWLATCKAGSTFSAVITPSTGEIRSGVSTMDKA